jgi:hypothetical protein
MTHEQALQAKKNNAEVTVIFTDDKPNPSGTINSVSPSGRATIKVTRPARGYDVGDFICVSLYEIRPYSWARTLPAE